jgi:hypothetical protein
MLAALIIMQVAVVVVHSILLVVLKLAVQVVMVVAVKAVNMAHRLKEWQELQTQAAAQVQVIMELQQKRAVQD